MAKRKLTKARKKYAPRVSTVDRINNYNAWNSMNTKEIKKEYNRIAKEARRRIDSLYDAGATYWKDRYDGTFDTLDKTATINDYRQQMSRLMSFFNSKTSTVRGYKNYVISQAERIGVKDADLESAKELGRKLKELKGSTEWYTVGSDTVINIFVRNMNDRKSIDESVKEIEDLYEKQIRDINDAEAEIYRQAFGEEMDLF